LYANSTVDIHTGCSRYPHKLETEEDRTRLIALFGQIRDRLIQLLHDEHERIVPDIMEWELTECDINKDVKVSDFFHMTGIKIQVKHLDHLFRLYVKSMGKDTVWRVEEAKQAFSDKKLAIDSINDIFNPWERVQDKVDAIEKKLDHVISNYTCSHHHHNINNDIEKKGEE
ncbi:MAG TPA: hypothetical protein VFJ51_08455, partial [Nitrososphaeraceae archaeon]|nr:hypothetical protein [Nitrososphaeraceae archaeon]